MTEQKTSPYIGRFAPTPSGPLHFGSLVAALGSWLQAKSQQGQWLVRIEDIDPPREAVGAAGVILQTLEDFGLHWDGSVSYQSQNQQRYLNRLQQLAAKDLLYLCQCTRKQLSGQHPYPGYCRERICRNPQQQTLALDSKQSTACSLRMCVSQQKIEFNDAVQGHQVWDGAQLGDFIIRRKDLLWSYQLAVVSDDIAEGITEVVRGLDLLDSTPWQIHLYQQLEVAAPKWAHLPLVLGNDGKKLSKQNLAPAINSQQRCQLLIKALQFLGQNPDKEICREGSVTNILQWATSHWNIQNIQPESTIIN
ncbi:tRNA glutamyl-Q(34) synthetase GluQRS [Pelagibaculum spongiae]|uniref:Glutamyl-Q tRNA(Asp) synthetase n=2 Tax=Pelagibaculum spongiae TaxID=2080658 RepID=A0A2V1H0T7_9GAMM|nr:tRNA glutamyl-Q(34) synthetase GluQRS [Pelagibaculum spongiae]